MRTVAYLRVSTIDQNLDKNQADILRLANDKALGQVEFIEEKCSGKISWRKRKIAEIIEELKQEDNLIVSEFSVPVGRYKNSAQEQRCQLNQAFNIWHHAERSLCA